jgi:hypothetical protein
VLPHTTMQEHCSDVFCNDREKEKNTNPQPQFTRVMLWGNLTKCDHRFSSLGLNLTCEGLLLVASQRPQGGGPKQLSPRWVEGFVHHSWGR